jgi:hypothetical protein
MLQVYPSIKDYELSWEYFPLFSTSPKIVPIPSKISTVTEQSTFFTLLRLETKLEVHIGDSKVVWLRKDFEQKLSGWSPDLRYAELQFPFLSLVVWKDDEKKLSIWKLDSKWSLGNFGNPKYLSVSFPVESAKLVANLDSFCVYSCWSGDMYHSDFINVWNMQHKWEEKHPGREMIPYSLCMDRYCAFYLTRPIADVDSDLSSFSNVSVHSYSFPIKTRL